MLMRSPLARDRRRPPGFIPPCQPVLADRVPTGAGWIHELKHDGFRILVRKDGADVRLWSRNGRDWSAEFCAIVAALRELPGSFVIDGEAVAHCSEGLPDFHPAPLGAMVSAPGVGLHGLRDQNHRQTRRHFGVRRTPSRSDSA